MESRYGKDRRAFWERRCHDAKILAPVFNRTILEKQGV
jgi:hypothetical protein